MIDPNVDATFDQYRRYYLAAKIIESNRTKDKLNILDVGGFGGKLADLLPHDMVTVIDVIEATGDSYIRKAALNVTFEDSCFDVVVAADTLEHVSSSKIQLFLQECYRVSRNFLIVVAPFESGRTSQIEKETNNLYQILADKPHPWLKEHREASLTRLEDVTSWTIKHNFKYFVIPNNLSEWRVIISQYFVLEDFSSRKGRTLFEKRNEHFNQTKNPLVADESEAFARAVVDFYNNMTWQKLSTNSQIVLDNLFSPDIARKSMEKLLAQI